VTQDYLPPIGYMLGNTKLAQLHSYCDAPTVTVRDAVTARADAAALAVLAVGTCIIHAGTAVVKVVIAAVQLPLYLRGQSHFPIAASEAWQHSTRSIRSAVTVLGGLAGIASPKWTLSVYRWVALDVKVPPKGLLAETAQKISNRTSRVWHSPYRNLVIGTAVVVALVALGSHYLPTLLASGPAGSPAKKPTGILIPILVGTIGGLGVGFLLWILERRYEKAKGITYYP